MSTHSQCKDLRFNFVRCKYNYHHLHHVTVNSLKSSTKSIRGSLNGLWVRIKKTAMICWCFGCRQVRTFFCIPADTNNLTSNNYDQNKHKHVHIRFELNNYIKIKFCDFIYQWWELDLNLTQRPPNTEKKNYIWIDCFSRPWL